MSHHKKGHKGGKTSKAEKREFDEVLNRLNKESREVHESSVQSKLLHVLSLECLIHQFFYEYRGDVCRLCNCRCCRADLPLRSWCLWNEYLVQLTILRRRCSHHCRHPFLFLRSYCYTQDQVLAWKRVSKLSVFSTKFYNIVFACLVELSALRLERVKMSEERFSRLSPAKARIFHFFWWTLFIWSVFLDALNFLRFNVWPIF